MPLKPFEYEELIRYFDKVEGMNFKLFAKICSKLLDYTEDVKQ